MLPTPEERAAASRSFLSSPLMQGTIQRAQTAPQIQQPQPPSWYDPKQSGYQNGLNLAENDRNYQNAYQDWGNEQSHWVDGKRNWDGFKAPAFNGPDAYGLANFTNGQEFSDETKANAALARLRQFDPNAKVVSGAHMLNEGQSDPYYSLQFDQSKLPTMKHPGEATAGPYGHNDLHNQNAVHFDPHYGVTTNWRNLKEPKPGALDKFGMLAPVALAAMTGGLGALPSLLMKIPGVLNGISSGNFNPLSLASMGLPFIPGMSPIMSQLGRVALGAASRPRGGR